MALVAGVVVRRALPQRTPSRTLLGTIIGISVTSSYLYVACLALAAGALLYVIGELLPLGRRLSWEVTLWGLLAGFLLGLATELVLAVAGG